MKLRIFILFLFLPLLRAQASVIDSLMTQPRDSIGLTSDSLVLHFLEESGIPISDNNKVKLLKSGREKFIDLFEAIRQAKHHVHLEYFNFRNDSIANALFALLAEKVKRRCRSAGNVRRFRQLVEQPAAQKKTSQENP